MICRYMGYSQASISVGIKMLREDGCLVRDSDGFLDITEKGETLAKKIKKTDFEKILLRPLTGGIFHVKVKTVIRLTEVEMTTGSIA